MSNPHQHIFDYSNRPLIVDNFAGGGGASTGIYLATGLHPDIAINHNSNALAIHKANHPKTWHLQTDIFEHNPKNFTMGRPVKFGWFSPDCTHFSKSKGDKPVDKKTRGLAWISLAWAMVTDIQIFMLENVEEFKTWGPLLQNSKGEWKPDKKKSGETFDGFIKALTSGINIDHPAFPEIREFLIPFLKEDYEEQKLINGLGFKVEHRELTACDFGAPTSRKRFFLIARRDGRKIIWPEPTHGSPKSMAVVTGKLKPWRTAAECMDWSIPTKSIFLTKQEAKKDNLNIRRPLCDSTLKRIVKGLSAYVFNEESAFLRENKEEQTFVNTFVAKNYGGGENGVLPKGSSLNSPLGTITTQDHNSLIETVMIPFVKRDFGKSVGGRISSPLATITSGGGGKASLVAVHAIKFKGDNIGYSMKEPVQTITAGGTHHGIVETFMIDYYGNGRPFSAERPMPTQTTRDRFAIIDIVCDKVIKDRIMEVRKFLTKYGVGLRLTEKQMLGIVTIKGVDYQITDIRMRMFTPRELFTAQGFPDTYIINPLVPYGKKGNMKPLPAKAQVSAVGNSVSPEQAAALIRANWDSALEIAEKATA